MMGEALDVPLNVSVYQRSSFDPPAGCRTAGRHLTAPALRVDRRAVVREVEPRAIRPVIAAVRPGGGAPAPTRIAPESRLPRLNGFVHAAGNPAGFTL